MSVDNPDYMGDESFFESINSLLSEHELKILAEVKAFCQSDFSSQIHTHFLQGKAFPREWIQKWADQGMLGLQVPKALGGKEASFACKVRVAQEVARHGFAPAFALNNLQGSVTRLARDGSMSQKNALLEKMLYGEILGAPAFTEPNGGTDLGALQMQAKRVPEGWLLNGTKAWITNGTIINCPIVLDN
jgi:alkylation response protein AidB-like acyl-CoA dehydrogenase